MRSQKNQPHHSLSWRKAMAVLLVVTMAVPLLAASPAAYGDTAPAAGQVLTSVALYNDQGQDLTTLPEVDPAAAFTLSYTYTIPPLTPTQTPAPGGNDAPANDAGLTPGTGETGNGDNPDNSENIAPPPSTGSDDQPAVLPPEGTDLDEGFGVDADLDEGFGVDMVASLIVSAMGSNPAEAEDPQTPPVPTQQPIITAPQDEPAPETPVASEQVYTFTIPAEIDLTGADTTVTITDVTGTTLGQATVDAVTNTGSLTLTDAAQNVPGLNGAFDITGCRFHQDALHLPTSQPSFFRSMRAALAVKDTTRELDFGLEGQSQQKQLRFALKEAETTTEKALPDGVITGVKLYVSETDKEDVLINESLQDVSKDATLTLQYDFTLPKEDTGTKFEANVGYTFAIPEALKIKTDSAIKAPLVIDGTDTQYGEAVLEGKTITLTFNEVAESAGMLDPEAEGWFWFQAGIGFDDTGMSNTGQQIITFPGTASGTNIKVNFEIIQPKVNITLAKTVTQNLAEQKLHWEIKVTPEVTNVAEPITANMVKIEDLVVTDTITEKHTYDESSVTIQSHKGEESGVVEGVTPKIEGTVMTCTFPTPLDSTAADYYTIAYDTKFEIKVFPENNSAVTFTNSAEANFNYTHFAAAGSESEDKTPVAEGTAKGVAAPANKDTSVQGVVLTKDGQLKSGSATELDWTVTINSANFAIDNGVITDTIPKGLTLDENTVYLNGTQVTKSDGGFTIEDVDNTIEDVDNTIEDVDNKKTKLTVKNVTLPLAGGSKTATLKYTTKVTDAGYIMSDKFTNEVNFKGGPGEGFSQHKECTVNVGASLFSKEALDDQYDRDKHEIHWQLNLNAAGSKLPAYTVTDTLPEPLELLTDSIKINSTSVTPSPDGTPTSGTPKVTASETGLTIAVVQDDTTVYTVTYTTAIKPEYFRTWTFNSTEWREMSDLKNTAQVQLDDQTFDIADTPNVRSQVMTKASKGYNAADKTVGWEITVNQNKMPIKNAVIHDEISTSYGHQYLPETFAVYDSTGKKIENPSVTFTTSENNTKVEIAFTKETISEQYTIRYTTKLTDVEELYDNDDAEVTNTAKLTGDSVPTEGITVGPVTTPVSQDILTKQGKVDSRENVIVWTVTINNNQLLLKEPVLSDVLNDQLILDPESIRLVKLKGTADTMPVPTPQYDAKTNVFEYKFNQDIRDAYQLVFTTDVRKPTDINQEISIANTIELKGIISASLPNNQPIKFQWRDGGGGGSGKYGRVVITKTDADDADKLLPGAVFELYKGNTCYKAVSGDGKNGTTLGEAVFDDVHFGTYSLREIQSPEGYVLNTEDVASGLQISGSLPEVDGVRTLKQTISNTKIKGSLTITKKDGGSDTPLAGAVFTLYQAQYSDGAEEPEWQQYGEPVTTGEDGLAVFLDLPFGNYYVVETTAPAGYLLGSRQESFAIEDNGQAVVYDDWLNYRPSTGGGGGGGVDGGGGGDTIAPPVPPKPPTNPVLPVNPMEPTTTTPADPAVPTDSETATEPEIATDGTVDPGTVDRVIEEIAPPDVPTEGQVDVPEGGAADLYLPPSHGTVTVDPDGHWVYTPDADFVGRDQFVIKVTHPDGEEEFILMDMEVPLAGMLPKTGETSRTGIYLAGLLCLLAGGLLLLKGRSRREQ